MKNLIAALVLIACMAFAGIVEGDLGLGATIVTEAQSDCDYGWTATASSGVNLFWGLEAGTRLMGTVYYPEHSHHPAITGTALGELTFRLDDEFGIELGGGIQYGNDEARAENDDEHLPVLRLGYDFTLASGHHVKPFAMWTIDADRKTVQAGFLFTFGR